MQLDIVQARVLGSLVEKAALTPEAYPLTLNAAVLACNQKTSRDPVMNLDEGRVGHALRTLEDLGLVRVVHAPRALRYEHCMDTALTLTPPQRALLGLLLLRGPQTASELLARAERWQRFEDLEDVRRVLDRLAELEPPLVHRLGRGAGQREERYAHAFAPAPVITAAERTLAPVRESEDDRLAALEVRIAALEARLAELELRR